jgi:anti-anti-sigma regulatory factor
MRARDVGKPAADQVSPTIVVGFREDVAVLGLVGEHDMATVEQVAFNITEQAAHGRGLVVSLIETQFIDTSLVRELFRGDQEMLRHGRRLVLHVGGNETIRRVLELAQVREQLLCCDSLEEAVAFASQCFS